MHGNYYCKSYLPLAKVTIKGNKSRIVLDGTNYYNSNKDDKKNIDDNNNNDNESDYEDDKYDIDYNDSDGEDVNDLISINEFSRIDRSLLHTGGGSKNNIYNNNIDIDEESENYYNKLVASDVAFTD